MTPAAGDATEEAARAALRQRLGKGARFDAPGAPHDALLLARRGTAYFARKLNELADPDLDAPSLRPGWSRRQLVAAVSYQARALAGLLAGLREGQPAGGTAARPADVTCGATLPARALRSLFRHTQVHLSVEWRDLGDADWTAVARTADGVAVAVRDTPVLRARTIWLAAVDLGNGGRPEDIPAALR